MIVYAQNKRCLFSRGRRRLSGRELALRPYENEPEGMGTLSGTHRTAGPVWARAKLRRPAADYLRDGIYELRAKQGHVQYRILYFFHERKVAILAHSLTKEAAIPPVEIERAIKRKKLFESNPRKYTYEADG